MIFVHKKTYVPSLVIHIVLFLTAPLLNMGAMVVLGEELDTPKANRFLEISSVTAQESEVTFVGAGPKEIKESVSLLGEVSLNEDTLLHVHPRFAGTVKSVSKRQGDEVVLGDVLAVIQSNESLAPYELKAEGKGKIIGKNIVPGEFIKDDQEVFTIANLSKLWVNAAAYESMLSKIKIGMAAIVTSDTSHISQESSIDYIDAFLLKPSRSQNMRIILDNAKGEWIPGMFVTVNVVTNRKLVPCAVPTASINSFDGKSVVFVQAKDNDKAKQGGKEGVEVRPVIVGQSDSEFSEIAKGLEIGENVAAANSFVLKAELEKGSAD